MAHTVYVLAGMSVCGMLWFFSQVGSLEYWSQSLVYVCYMLYCFNMFHCKYHKYYCILALTRQRYISRCACTCITYDSTVQPLQELPVITSVNENVFNIILTVDLSSPFTLAGNMYVAPCCPDHCIISSLFCYLLLHCTV